MPDDVRPRLLVEWRPVAVAEPLARSLVVKLTGFDPGPLHHTCPSCGSVEHGRPYVDAPVHVSVAHVPGLTVVAATDLGPVGVDLEPGDDHAWVRREAIGKARGLGLRADPSDDLAREIIHEEPLEIPGYAGLVVVLSGSAAVAEPSGATSLRTGR